MSQRFNSYPMWAHYAEQHKGCCLEFNFSRLEVGTPFYSLSPSQLPCIDSVADIGDAVVATAATAGFTRYEISAYAKDEKYLRAILLYNASSCF